MTIMSGKTNGITYTLFGIVLALAVIASVWLTKRIVKPITQVQYDTVFVYKIDTVWKTKYYSKPQYDTIFTEELLSDSDVLLSENLSLVDTSGIVADYFKNVRYDNDTIVDDQSSIVILHEEVRFNRIQTRLVDYRNKAGAYTTVPCPDIKKNAKLYVGAEIGSRLDGLSEVSVGLGLKDKKDRFYTLSNNMIDGFNLNVSVGLYIPITK